MTCTYSHPIAADRSLLVRDLVLAVALAVIFSPLAIVLLAGA